MEANRHARITQRAHKIWLDEDQVDGKDAEHWHRAEREIAAEDAAACQTPVAGQNATAGADAEKTARRPGRPRAKPAVAAPATAAKEDTPTSGSRTTRRSPSRVLAE